MRPDERRYPIQPILDRTGWSHRDFAEHDHVELSTIRKRVSRGLSAPDAERIAVRLLHVPAVAVWPDFGEVPCANDRCDEMFAPTTNHHVYCSRRCQQRVADRRYAAKRRSDDARREAQRAYLAEYRSSERAREIERRRRRAYYLRNRERELARQREYDATVRAPRRAAAKAA